MVDSKTTRYSLLFAFVALAAGGPALHRADVFGLHSCDHGHLGHVYQGEQHAGRGNHSASVTVDIGGPASDDLCACKSDHEVANSQKSDLSGLFYGQTANLTAAGTRNSDQACDGMCSVCQFFSSISFQAAASASAPFNEFGFSTCFVAPVSQPHAAKHSYYERGPPAFFLVAQSSPTELLSKAILG